MYCPASAAFVRRACARSSAARSRLSMTSGRTGANLSRINRDIRFAKDKTPYRAQMYLKFGAPFAGEGETGQLYVGISAKTVTAGFRIYCGSKRKESALGQIADARVQASPGWVAQQKKRLSRRYESYWYRMEKGEWTKQSGWPAMLRTGAKAAELGSCGGSSSARQRQRSKPFVSQGTRRRFFCELVPSAALHLFARLRHAKKFHHEEDARDRTSEENGMRLRTRQNALRGSLLFCFVGTRFAVVGAGA